MIDHITAFIKRHRQKTLLVFITIGILLLGFGIYERLTPSVRIGWMTESEINTLGFNLVRGDLSDPGEGEQINPQLILAQGSPISGTSYHFVDWDVKAGKSYTYHLQEINNNNEIVELESIEIRVKQEGFTEIGIGIILSSMALFLNKRNKNFIQRSRHEKF